MNKIFVAMLSLSIALPASAQMLGGRGGAGGLQMLEKADTNGDGYTTRAEYRAAREGQFQRMDRNGDGSVTRSDFGRLAKFKPDAVDKLMALLSGADTNDDGRITRAELSAAPMPMFDHADANGDDRLSQAEVRTMKERAAARR